MSNVTRFALGLAALAALAGCGGDGATPPPAPAPVPAPGPAPTPAPVSVQSIEPADGTSKVDIRPVLRIVLDGSIDPASVTAGHVQFLARGYPQQITLSYDDATHTIAIAPGTLQHDTAYTLAVSGLVDANGKTVASQQAKFSTWVNAQLAGRAPDGSFGYSITLDASGRPVSGPASDAEAAYTSYTYLPNGLLSKTEIWRLGGDLQPNTADDLRTTAINYDYDANGALLTATTHYGADGVHNVSDVQYTYSYDANGRQVFYVGAVAGNDGLLGTADDQIGYHATNFDAQGNTTTTLASTQVNADGRTFPTAAVYSFSAVTQASATAPERNSYYSSAGADAQPFTSDDVLSKYSEITRDSRGNIQRVVFYDTPFASPPGTALAISDYLVNTYDAHDNLVQRIVYADAGADGVWLTADDTAFEIADFDTTH